MSRSLFLSLAAGLFLATSTARAESITSLMFSNDTPTTENFGGRADYDATSGDLTLSVTNDGPGAMTGFGFNSVAPGLLVGLQSQSLQTGDVDFTSSGLTTPDHGQYNFGSYDFGASLGSLAPGHTGKFIFSVTLGGNNPGSIEVSNFFTPSNGREPLVAQFGDEFVADLATVPLPPAAWAGLALLGVFGFAQRFSSRRLRTV
jgi:hypothetical protein